MRGMILGAAVALVFGVGCQQGRTNAEDVQAQREEVIKERQDFQEQQAQAQQDAQEQQTQAQQDAQEQQAQAQQDADSQVQSEREDVAKAEEELAQTRQDYQQTQAEEQAKAQEEQQEDTAVGGAGTQGMQSLSGKVDAKKPDELTLKTDDGEKKLMITPDTQFTWNGKDVKVDDVPKGAEVRASFTFEGQNHVADKVEVLSAPKK